jgi:hypothetical protein
VDVGFSASNLHSFDPIRNLTSVQQGHRFSWLDNLPNYPRTPSLPLARSVPPPSASEAGEPNPMELDQATSGTGKAKAGRGRPKGAKDGKITIRGQNTVLKAGGLPLLHFNNTASGRGRGRGRGGGGRGRGRHETA